MIRAGLTLVLLLGAALPARAQSAGDAEPAVLLQRIGAAARQLNYTGTFVYQRGATVQTSRIAHLVDDSGEHERIEMLDGPPREVVRSNDTVSCYFADRKMVKVGKRRTGKSFPAIVPDQSGGLAEYYNLRLLGMDRVAGFECRELALEPRDAMRYGHRLCADVASGLLLRSRTVGERGEVVEQFAFTQLNIGGDIPRERVEPRASTSEWQVENAAASEGESVDTGWFVGSPPPGFRKIAETRRMLSSRPVPISHLVYSDGLSAVSVFIEALPGGGGHVAHGLSQQGAINVYTRTVSRHMITVLGEAPPATVMQIGNSIGQRGR